MIDRFKNALSSFLLSMLVAVIALPGIGLAATVDLTVENIYWNENGLIPKADICNRGSTNISSFSVDYTVNGKTSSISYPPGLLAGNCIDMYSGWNNIKFALEDQHYYDVTVRTTIDSGLAENNLENNSMTKNLRFVREHDDQGFCYLNILPGYNVQTISTANQVSQDINQVYIVKSGGSITNLAGHNTYFVESGGYVDTGESSSNVIYIEKDATFYNSGGTANNVYYELGADLVNLGSGAPLAHCEDVGLTAITAPPTPVPTPSLADVVVSNLRYDSGSEQLYADVCNLGGTSVDGINVHFSLVEQGSGNIPLANPSETNHDSVFTPNMCQGTRSYEIGANYSLQYGKTYVAKVEASPKYRGISEQSLSNNEASITLNYRGTDHANPDLTIASVEFDTNHTAIKANVCNEGIADVANFGILFEANGVSNNLTYVPTLPHGTCTDMYSWGTNTFYLSPQVTYGVTVTVDPYGTVAEILEGNNSKTVNLTYDGIDYSNNAPKPDLQIKSVDWNAYNDNELVVQYCNVGTQDVLTSFDIRFQIDVEDFAVPHTANWMPAGSCTSVGTGNRMTFSSGTPYYYTITVDSHGDVDESNEGNNSYSASIRKQVSVTPSPDETAYCHDLEQSYTIDLDTNTYAANQGADVWFEAQTESLRYLSGLGRAIKNVGQWSVGAKGCSEQNYDATTRIPISSLRANDYVCAVTDNGYAQIHVIEAEHDGKINVCYTKYDKYSSSLRTPAQYTPADGSHFTNFPRTITLSWQKINETAQYIVDVDCFHCDEVNRWSNDVGKTYIRENVGTNTSYTFDFVGDQPGRWRVTAIDSVGNTSVPSPWRYFDSDTSGYTDNRADLIITDASASNENWYVGDTPEIKVLVRNTGQVPFEHGKAYIRAEAKITMPDGTVSYDPAWGFSDVLSPEQAIPVNGGFVFYINNPLTLEGDYEMTFHIEYPEWAKSLDADHSNNSYGTDVMLHAKARNAADSVQFDFEIPAGGVIYDADHDTFEAKVCLEGNRSFSQVPVSFEVSGRGLFVSYSDLYPGCQPVVSWPISGNYSPIETGGSYDGQVVVDPYNEYTETNELNNFQNFDFSYRGLSLNPVVITGPILLPEVSASGVLKKDVSNRYILIDLDGGFLSYVEDSHGDLSNYEDKGIIVYGRASRAKKTLTVERVELIVPGRGSYNNDLRVKYDLGASLYNDIDTLNTGVWFVPYLQPLYGRGIFQGYPDGRFGGDNTLNIAELTKVVVVSAGLPVTTEPGDDHWASAYMRTAQKYGLYDSVNYDNPDSWSVSATRLQAVQAVIRANALQSASAGTGCFPDIANAEVCRAQSLGIISGYPDGRFAPNDTLKRSQMAKIIFRAMDVAGNINR